MTGMIAFISNADHAAHWAVFVTTFLLGVVIVAGTTTLIATDRLESEVVFWIGWTSGVTIAAGGAGGIIGEALGWT